MSSGEKKVGKILVLGPPKAGKTTLSRLLSDYMDESRSSKKGKKSDGKERTYEFEFSKTYTPTKAVRIQEFESREFMNKTKQQRVLRDIGIELWDVSGDKRYEDCWPAIRENADGVILVANPEEHRGSDFKIWYDEFIAKDKIDLKNVMVILNEMGSKKTNHEEISSFEILPQLRTVAHVAHHFGSEAAQMKEEVNEFMATVLRIIGDNDDTDDVNHEDEDEF